MTKKCAYLNCKSKKTKAEKQRSFYKLPDDPRLRDLWLKNSGNTEEDSNFFNFYICDLHFKAEDLTSKRELTGDAVPVMVKIDPKVDPKKKCCPHAHPKIPSEVAAAAVDEPKIPKKRTKTSKAPAKRQSFHIKVAEIERCIKEGKRFKDRSKTLTEFTPKVWKLRPNAIMSKLDLDGVRFSTLYSEMKKRRIYHALTKRFPAIGYSTEWTMRERKSFLRLFYRSPEAYEHYFDTTKRIPPLSRIYKWLYEEPWLLDARAPMLRVLKNQVRIGLPIEFNDDMAALSWLSDAQTAKRVVLVIDTFVIDEEDPSAEKAFMLMVRGMNHKYAKPICLYKGALDLERMRALLVSAIRTLFRVGFDLRAVTTKMHPYLLGTDTGATYLRVDNRKVHIFYDTYSLLRELMENELPSDQGTLFAWSARTLNGMSPTCIQQWIAESMSAIKRAKLDSEITAGMLQFLAQLQLLVELACDHGVYIKDGGGGGDDISNDEETGLQSIGSLVERLESLLEFVTSIEMLQESSQPYLNGLAYNLAALKDFWTSLSEDQTFLRPGLLSLEPMEEFKTILREKMKEMTLGAAFKRISLENICNFTTLRFDDQFFYMEDDYPVAKDDPDDVFLERLAINFPELLA